MSCRREKKHTQGLLCTVGAATGVSPSHPVSVTLGVVSSTNHVRPGIFRSSRILRPAVAVIFSTPAWPGLRATARAAPTVPPSPRYWPPPNSCFSFQVDFPGESETILSARVGRTGRAYYKIQGPPRSPVPVSGTAIRRDLVEVPEAMPG
jgi:hypothetical protein